MYECEFTVQLVRQVAERCADKTGRNRVCSTYNCVSFTAACRRSLTMDLEVARVGNMFGRNSPVTASIASVSRRGKAHASKDGLQRRAGREAQGNMTRDS